MKGLIVGGGIAGLTSAILLEKAGFEIEIAEIAPNWGPVGAGIVLWPNCLKILGKLGLRDETESLGNIIEEMAVTDERGKKISSLKFGKVFEKGLYAVAIARPDLHSVLASGIKTTQVYLNDTVKEITNENRKAQVTFKTGRQNEYDFIIGADGINSKVRKFLFGEVKPRYSGYTNWRFMINGDFDFDRRHAYEMWGKGKRFGMVPVGSENKYYCFAVLNSPPKLDSNRNIANDKFKEIFSEFGWIAPEFLKLVDKDTILIHNDLEDIRLKQWQKGNVVLIGDAAHAITPNLGAGAAMAMEDSIIIAENLINTKSPENAFRSFFQSRYKRVNRICNDSYRLGKMGTLENAALRNVRNFISRIIPERFYINIVKTVIGEK